MALAILADNLLNSVKNNGMFEPQASLRLFRNFYSRNR